MWECFSELIVMGVFRCFLEFEKVFFVVLMWFLVLELKVEELEEKGLICILWGLGDVVFIEIFFVVVVILSGGDVLILGVLIGFFSLDFVFVVELVFGVVLLLLFLLFGFFFL